MTHSVAVITGAANGIGLALAKCCLQAGYSIVMADKDAIVLQQRVEALRNDTQGDVLGILCDVTDKTHIEALAKETYQRFDHVDLLINNAGISGRLAPIWELTLEDIQQVIDINLYGMIYGVHAFLPRMFEQASRAHIVNMASVYSLCSGSKIAPYAMSKHAALAFSESLYFDLQRLDKPIDVSVICPSFVNTSLLKQVADPMHDLLGSVVEQTPSAEVVAEQIFSQIQQRCFYILPDRSIKSLVEERFKAIIEQDTPYRHGFEKLMRSLSDRI